MSSTSIWSVSAIDGLMPQVITPFSWSILGPTAERAWRSTYADLGYTLPDNVLFWRRHDARVYLNTTAVRDANMALFGESQVPNVAGSGILGRGPSRRYEATLQQLIAEAPGRFAAIDRWWEFVKGIEWRQATILQIMEEIEPRAQNMLAYYVQLALALQGHRYQLEQWIREWLPQQADQLTADLLAGLDGRTAQDRQNRALWRLSHAAREDSQVAGLLQTGGWQPLSAGSAFQQALERFQSDYGQWSVDPLEASTPRWREDQGALLAKVTAEMQVGQAEQVVDPEGQAARRHETATAVREQLGILRRRQFDAVVDRAEHVAELLADCIHHLVTVAGVARVWALGAANEALVDGRLRAADEVFLLELEELKQMMTGEWSNPSQVLPLVVQRQVQQAAWVAASPEAVIEDQ